ncbi:MAG: MFS transporter [Proteobacteria bacterium]|nr:MFS transporter [Pseudomonadota bacterium]
MHDRIIDTSQRLPRWLLATVVLLGLSVFINYIDRGNLATAAPSIRDEFQLSTSQLGFLLTAFFITYIPMQIAVGWLSDRYGAAHVLLTGFVVWSLAMTLTGLAQGFVMLVGLRLLLGLGESVSFPTASSIIARSVPESARGIANAATSVGLSAGPAFGIFFGGMLIAAYGWRWFFAGFGLVSLLWVIPWLTIAQPHLPQPRAINAESGPPTAVLLRTPALWYASLGHFGVNYVWYFVLNWIPYYLVRERGWTLAQMATIGGVSYLLMAVVATANGWITDRRIRAGISHTRVCKTYLAAGACIVGACVAACALASTMVSACLLVLACAAFGLTAPHIYLVAQTLAGPAAAGRWVGMQNCLGNIAGLIAPFLTGVLVDRTGSFVPAFLIAAAASLLGGAAWVFGLGEIKPIAWSRQDYCGEQTTSRAVP